ncbi:TPA: phage tail protein [Citrobacter freundii]
MNRTDSPVKQAKPFGVNGQREPLLPTTPAGDNTASYDLGFPPITMILKSAGGLPPKGQDMNQILYELSSLCRWFSAGAMNTYDSAFATAIGGYPAGSFVLGDDLKTVYRCTTNGTTTNPNSVTTGWAKQADDINQILQLGSAAGRNVGNSQSYEIPDMSYFPLTGLGSDNLLVKLPNGLILQIFRRRLSNSTTIGIPTTIPVTYPTPFPTNIWGVFCTKSTYAQIVTSCESATALGFDAVTCLTSGTSPGSNLSDAYFLAIGY